MLDRQLCIKNYVCKLFITNMIEFNETENLKAPEVYGFIDYLHTRYA